jgi:hypothetical protein
MYRAPSWTWASSDCGYLQWLDIAFEHTSEKILDWRLSCKDDDPFGEVLDGHLNIEAPIKQGWLVPSSTHPEHFDFWDGDWIAKLTDRRPTHLNHSLGNAYLDVYDATDLSIVREASYYIRV